MTALPVGAPSRRAKVLVIDDSALMRRLLVEILGRSPDLEVVGAAPDPYAAWEIVRQQRPDVLTLDVEMPRMDGLTFLERLMKLFPLPVVMVSSLTEQAAATTLRALELGAVDFVTKPKLDVTSGTVALAEEIVAKVRAAARARVRVPSRAPAPVAAAATARAAAPVRHLQASSHRVIAIGASTGGTEALRELLAGFPADAPGTVVVQHMPGTFTRAFAERLDASSQIRVVEARDGMRIMPGHALVAPGGMHMKVARDGAAFVVRVGGSQPVNHHCPSVDVLFDSVADAIGAHAVGVILTGMGGDGARGMRRMRDAGARTLGQDEATCVVYGMPREAMLAGGVEKELPLGRMASEVIRLVS